MQKFKFVKILKRNVKRKEAAQNSKMYAMNMVITMINVLTEKKKKENVEREFIVNLKKQNAKFGIG